MSRILRSDEFLVRELIARGYMITVFDEEGDMLLKRSVNRATVMSVINDVEQATLNVRNQDGIRVGFAILIDGNAPDELVADYGIAYRADRTPIDPVIETIMTEYTQLVDIINRKS